MKYVSYVLTLVCIFSLIFMQSNRSLAGEWTGNANFILGSKVLDEDDWEPYEDQGEFGIDIDFRKQNWPVSIVVASYGSYEEKTVSGNTVEASTSELRAGARKVWKPMPKMRPYLGGGIALVRAELDGQEEDEDSGLGAWCGGGVYWTLGSSFNLGFNLGYSYGEVTLFGDDMDAGGSHAGLLLGYHW
jgi:hypothetical protein